MIKIRRTEKPIELTDEHVEKLTADFLADRKNRVWRQPYIVDGLLAMSHRKCVYCERIIGESGQDMHVEHYHPKEQYPHEVVL